MILTVSVLIGVLTLLGLVLFLVFGGEPKTARKQNSKTPADEPAPSGNTSNPKTPAQESAPSGNTSNSKTPTQESAPSGKAPAASTRIRPYTDSYTKTEYTVLDRYNLTGNVKNFYPDHNLSNCGYWCGVSANCKAFTAVTWDSFADNLTQMRGCRLYDSIQSATPLDGSAVFVKKEHEASVLNR